MRTYAVSSGELLDAPALLMAELGLLIAGPAEPIRWLRGLSDPAAIGRVLFHSIGVEPAQQHGGSLRCECGYDHNRTQRMT